MKTLKEKIEKAIKDNLILSVNEAESAINFVSDLLEDLADETEQKESYATRSIAEMRESASRVRDLNNTLEEEGIDFDEIYNRK